MFIYKSLKNKFILYLTLSTLDIIYVIISIEYNL